MSCARIDLEVCQYATYRKNFFWQLEDDDGNLTPQDLTGYSARMDIATAPNINPLITLSTVEGNITITAPDGKIAIHIDEAETALLTQEKYSYDLVLYSPSGDATRLVGGLIRVSHGVTTETPPV